MVWIETGRCRNHPHHTQSEGVCSSCLTEKLSTLTSSAAASGGSGGGAGSCSSSGTNSPPESSRSSIHVSPALRHRRNASEASSFAAAGASGDGLKKSRSVAYVARSRGGEGKGSKKKGWFWSRLLRSTTAKRSGRDGGVVVAVADS